MLIPDPAGAEDKAGGTGTLGLLWDMMNFPTGRSWDSASCSPARNDHKVLVKVVQSMWPASRLPQEGL